MVCAMGGLPKCAKFTCSGDAFAGCWLRLISWSVDHIFIVIYINAVTTRVRMMKTTG